MKKIKILCVCRSGRVRSIVTKNILNERGYTDVLTVGGLLVSAKTMDILSDWADIILLAKPHHGDRIDKKYRHKINSSFYIGDDLDEIVKKQLDSINLKHGK